MLHGTLRTEHKYGGNRREDGAEEVQEEGLWDKDRMHMTTWGADREEGADTVCVRVDTNERRSWIRP